MFILHSNAMSELMSSSLTGIKTAECLYREKGKYFMYTVIRMLQLTSPTGTSKCLASVEIASSFLAFLG